MAIGDYSKAVRFGADIAGHIPKLGFEGPVTVRLTKDDGMRFASMLVDQMTPRIENGAARIEIAGVNFEWPASMPDEERKNLGL